MRLSVRIRSDGDGQYVGVQGGGDLEPAGGGAGAAVALHPAGAHLPEDQEHPPHQRTVGEYSRDETGVRKPNYNLNILLCSGFTLRF